MKFGCDLLQSGTGCEDFKASKREHSEKHAGGDLENEFHSSSRNWRGWRSSRSCSRASSRQYLSARMVLGPMGSPSGVFMERAQIRRPLLVLHAA